MKVKYTFYIVGVGGTGSLFARDLPQLLIGTNHQMVLIDGDIVVKKNVARQSYQIQDVGLNKAIALARKINSFYDIQCEAIDKYITLNELAERIKKDSSVPVIVGCVDNDATRKLLEETFKKQKAAVYIDSANSAYSGNVFVTVKSNKDIHGKLRSEVYELKNDKKPTDKSCQEYVSEGNLQYMVTNAKMAVCILEHCFNLITDEPILSGVTKIDRFAQIHY